MGFIRGLLKVAGGAGAGVAALTALPIFGAVGVITVTGAVVGAIIGAVAGVADEVIDNKKENASARKRVRRKLPTT